MNLLALATAAFLYPGLLTALAAGAVFGLLGARRQGRAPLGGAIGTREGLAALAAALLAGLDVHAAKPTGFRHLTSHPFADTGAAARQ